MDLVLFTALHDAHTIDRRAMHRLRAASIPVVPMSILTLEEIAPIAAAYSLRQPMVIEAGGAIAWPAGGGWEVDGCGPCADTLLDVVTEIEDRAGASLLVLSAQDGASERAFSEPFAIESGDLAKIRRAASELGFAIRKGPREFHLARRCDEAEAFKRVREELACETTIGIGTSPVDAAFLKYVDFPMIAGTDKELIAAVPTAHVAPTWSAAVDEALRIAARGMRRAAAG